MSSIPHDDPGRPHPVPADHNRSTRSVRSVALHDHADGRPDGGRLAEETALVRLGVHQGAMAAVAYCANVCGLDEGAALALAVEVDRMYPDPFGRSA
jgi:hypothetical protein